MEKNNKNRSVFESSKNTISEYIIELGNTTYENTLEERIQNAKNASASAKLAQKKCTEEKLSNIRNVKGIYVQNLVVLKSRRSAQNKNKQWVSINKTDVQTSTHVPLLKNITKTQNINSNFESKSNSSGLKSTNKGGSSMQQRLEAIKANKKFSNKSSHEYINDLESNNLSKNVSFQNISQMKNYRSKLCNTYISKGNEYKTRSTVQKNPIEEVKYTGHCDRRTEDITNTPFSETIVSTKLGNQCILKNSKSNEPDYLSFVYPQTSCNQQTLEHKKNTQFNNDESMEWEDIETDNIVEKVNDIRRIEHEYEPMEWTPDSIMHSDRINYCLVIDTNILLSDLKSITIVIDKYLTDYGYPTIVLPWQVLLELDRIKVGNSTLNLRAREAVRWLCHMLSKCHPRLKGQPMTKKNGINGDDDILKCAITVRERVNIVYLVTDDNILRIKSEFSGISVKSSRWLKSLITNTNQKD